jgi:2-isopropylmalate synthase
MKKAEHFRKHVGMDNAARYTPYERQFEVDLADRTWPTRRLTSPPIWCSVDLRDGNQALERPMDVHRKLVYFDKLVNLGFKEIEVGFPSASETEFQFNRQLADTGRIPDDVYPQVLTQAREHLIKRTFESLQGYRQAIVHLYNSTSELQRRVVFNLPADKIIDMAVKGTYLVKEEAAKSDTKILFQYSPESFTGTERSVALDVCAAVIEAWNPEPGEKIIINLPATVEMSTPNVYADLIEWFSRNLPRRDQVILSLHTHNDRGTGVAATELGLLAGGERVEGTLFGNGERTGNVDLVTLALNLFTQGIDPGLDLRDVPGLVELVQECTEMQVHPRHPYAGELVFTAFSGSHQDAIRKGIHALRGREAEKWEVPYVPVDPADIGRELEGVIRINSQSGKGGIAFVMEREFGCHLPKQMHPEFSAEVQKVSDASGAELSPDAIWTIFADTYLRAATPYKFISFTSQPLEVGAETYKVELKVEIGGVPTALTGWGNGPIDACRNALIRSGCQPFRIANYTEHARTAGSDAEAVAFIQVESSSGKLLWGAGIHPNIEMASIRAILSAVNRVGQIHSVKHIGPNNGQE